MGPEGGAVGAVGEEALIGAEAGMGASAVVGAAAILFGLFLILDTAKHASGG